MIGTNIEVQLEQAGLGQDRGEQGKDASVKSPLSSHESFHETRKYKFREPRHTKPDDEKYFFINLVKAVTAGRSVAPFVGDPRKFKHWL